MWRGSIVPTSIKLWTAQYYLSCLRLWGPFCWQGQNMTIDMHQASLAVFFLIYICKKWIWFFSFEAFFWKTNRFLSLILVILGLSVQSVGHWARHQTQKSSDRQAAGDPSRGVLATRGVFSCGRLVAKHWVIFNSKSVFSIKQVFLDDWRKTKE